MANGINLEMMSKLLDEKLGEKLVPVTQKIEELGNLVKQQGSRMVQVEDQVSALISASSVPHLMAQRKADKVAGTGHTLEVPLRQPPKESDISKLSIYDPAIQIKNDDDDKDEATPVTSRTMLHNVMMQKLVGAWRRRADGRGFDLLMVVIILANAVVMSIQLEYEGTSAARSIGLSPDITNWPSAGCDFFVLQHVFSIIYVLEIVARVRIWGLQYYRSVVNVLDLGIVIVSLLNMYVLPGAGASLPNVIYLRLLCLAKWVLIQSINAFSKSIRQRVLIHSIISSFGALLWSMLFVALIHLSAAIMMTQSLQSCLNDEEIDPALRQNLYIYFGTFLRTCLALYQISLDPGSWSRTGYILIFDVSTMYILFAIYALVVTFGISRLMTALLLREAFAAANSDKGMVLEEELIRSQKMQKESLKALFDKIDVAGGGVVSLDELRKTLEDPRSVTLLKILKVDAYEVVQLLHLLDKMQAVHRIENASSALTVHQSNETKHATWNL